MPSKLILCWNIEPGSETEYFEFMVSEFMPGLQRLGIIEPAVWYTAYGEVEQILVSGVTETNDHMHYVLGSNDWLRLKNRLEELVNNFTQKVIAASSGFQL